MGYFNYFVKCVIRKFVNFIFNKKNFFKFCCILFLVLVITKLFLQTPISYGATTNINDTTYYDGYLANIELMDALQNDLITRCIATTSYENLDLLNNYLLNGAYSACFYYGNSDGSEFINSLPNYKRFLSIVFIPTEYSERTTQYRNWANNGEILTSNLISTVDYPVFMFDESNLSFYTFGARQFTHYYPTYLYNYKGSTLIEYLKDYFNKDSGELGEIIANTNNQIVESNKEVQNTIQEQTNTIQEQTNTIKQQQEFLTNNTISDESVILPEDTTNDTTGVDDEINFLFNDIMSAFTDTSSNNSISLTFPFTNQTFDISYASIYNGVFEKNNSMAYLKRIIQLGYWYIVAVFVIKDVSDKVNKVKTGDIDKIQTGNIKEDLL